MRASKRVSAANSQVATTIAWASLLLLLLKGSEDGDFSTIQQAHAFQFSNWGRRQKNHGFGIRSSSPDDMDYSIIPPKPPPIIDRELPTDDTEASFEIPVDLTSSTEDEVDDAVTPQEPPPIIDIELPSGDDDTVASETRSSDLPFYLDEDEEEDDDLDAAIASVSKVAMLPDDPLSMGSKSSSFIDGNVGSSPIVPVSRDYFA